MTITSPTDWSSCPRRLVGLMSGTSLDGIDAAVIEVEGGIPPSAWRQLAFYTRPYTTEEHDRIAGLLRADAPLLEVMAADAWLGALFADAALRAIATAGLRPEEIDAIASHGQTIWHVPPRDGQAGLTCQLGAAAVIAEHTGLLTVTNFRQRDMAAGGQGAPLVPFVDYLLFHRADRAVAVQNIGGIGNVTWLRAGGTLDEIIAFDTGPGNMVIDALVARGTEGRETYDRDGARARRGAVNAAMLDELLTHPYLAQAPPKSTGRELFGARYAELVWATARARGMALDDLLATVTALTAASIARAYHDFLWPRGAVDEVILGGGGSHNAALRAMLAARLPGIPVLTHEDRGVSSDAKEAIAFALLGHATLCGVPANVPAATGAAHAVLLGQITPGTLRVAP